MDSTFTVYFVLSSLYSLILCFDPFSLLAVKDLEIKWNPNFHSSVAVKALNEVDGVNINGLIF